MTRTVFGQVVRTQACDRCGGDGRIPKTPCGQCRGAGLETERRELSVDIPAGIDDGQRVRLTGRGHAGERGGPAGDLYVLVGVQPDPRFERRGEDLVTRLDVPFTQAALGATMTRRDAWRASEELELEPGSQPGTVKRLRGHGLPALRRPRPGRPARRC